MMSKMTQICDAVKDRRSERTIRFERREQFRQERDRVAAHEEKGLVDVKLEFVEADDDCQGTSVAESSSSDRIPPGPSSVDLVSAALNKKASKMEAAAKRIQELAFERDHAFLIRPDRVEPSRAGLEEILVGVAEEPQAAAYGESNRLGSEEILIAGDPQAASYGESSRLGDDRSRWISGGILKWWLVVVLLVFTVIISSLIVVEVTLEVTVKQSNGTIAPVVPVPRGPISKFRLRNFDCVYGEQSFCFSDDMEVCILMKDHSGRRPKFARVVPYTVCSKKFCDGFICFEEI